MKLDDEAIQVLSCDISIRPVTAAGIEHVLPFLRSLRVEDNAVLAQFEQAGTTAVESFVDAERLCCTSLTWDLALVDDCLQLRIVGTSDQTGLIKQWFEN